MKKYIYLITLGPVQDFIAQARKTRDLAAGSRLLADLIKTAMAYLKTKGLQEEDIVFPNKEIETPSNRILVLVKTEAPQELGEALELHLKDEFIRKARAALKKISPAAKKQLEDYLKIYWMALPYEEETYQKDFVKLEKMLGGLKQLRSITQLQEKGRKCAIDGLYNVEYYRKLKGEKEVLGRKAKLFRTTATVLNYESSRLSASTIQPGEGLSAVSMFKRRYPLKEEDAYGEYPSTAVIALKETIAQLRAEKKPDLACINMIMNSNAQFFYEENLERGMFEKLTTAESNQCLSREMLQKCQQQLTLRARQHQPKLKFTKYYSILLFDVDDMGKLLSGDKNKVKEDINLFKFQRKISDCMAAFSKKVLELMEKKNSVSVYAGGDDFLGFVNINHLLPLLAEIRKALNLENEIFKPLKEFLKEGVTITLSAAATIAHYKTPLATVLNTTRQALKEAKSSRGKNALALSVLKKSGEMEQSIWKWQYDSLPSTPLIFNDLVEQLQGKKLSNAFIAPFERLFKPMLLKDALGDDFDEIVAVELARLMLRAKVDGEKKDIEAMAQILSKLYQQDKSMTFFNFTALLNILDFISRHLNDLKTDA